MWASVGLSKIKLKPPLSLALPRILPPLNDESVLIQASILKGLVPGEIPGDRVRYVLGVKATEL